MNIDERQIHELNEQLSKINSLIIAYKRYVDINRRSCAGWTTEFVETVLDELLSLTEHMNEAGINHD